jgi:Leucine-rich repeat (LRR) protein
LTKLDLSFNQLKIIPECLNKLINLEELNFSHNRIIELPESIRNLTNLKKLSLEVNYLTRLPDWIGDLVNLEVLDFGAFIPFPEDPKNRIETLPDSIGNLTNLKQLSISNLNLTSIPASIGNLVSLEHLNLYNNQIKQLPESIGRLSKLKVLWLNNNKIFELPDSICLLKNLEKLLVGDNQLKTLPDSIDNLAYVKEINLNRNPYTTIPQSLGKLDIFTIYPILDKLANAGDPIAMEILSKNLYSILETGDVGTISKTVIKDFFTNENLPKIEKILFEMKSNFLKNATTIIREDKREEKELCSIFSHLIKLGSTKVRLFVKKELLSHIQSEDLFLSVEKSRFLSYLSEDDLFLIFNQLPPKFFELLHMAIMKEEEYSDPILFFFCKLGRCSVDYILEWVKKASDVQILHLFYYEGESLFFLFSKEHREMFLSKLNSDDIGKFIAIFLTTLIRLTQEKPYNLYNYKCTGLEISLTKLLTIDGKCWEGVYNKIIKNIPLEEELLFISHLYLARVLETLESDILIKIFSMFDLEDVVKTFNLFELQTDPTITFYLNPHHFIKLETLGIKILLKFITRERDWERLDGFMQTIEAFLEQEESHLLIYNEIINLLHNKDLAYNQDFNEILLHRLLPLLPLEDLSKIIIDADVGILKRIYILPLDWHRDSFTNLASLLSISIEELCFKWMPEEERRAIEDLKKITKKSFNILNGLEITDPPNFEIDQEGHVTHLSLYGCSIEFLPESMESLKHLIYLSLTWTDLKEIPLYIGNFQFLTEFLAGYNELEYLPETIGTLTNLKHLYLEKNNLQELPESIGNLLHLENLDIYENPIKQLPQSFIRLKNLRYLYIDSSIYYKIPEAIRRSCTVRDRDHWTHMFSP